MKNSEEKKTKKTEVGKKSIARSKKQGTKKTENNVEVTKKITTPKSITTANKIKDNKKTDVKNSTKKTGKKVVKIIIGLILVIVIMFFIHTIRNYVIVTSLQNKVSTYANSTNYYKKTITNENNGTIVTTKYYKKDNKQVMFLERNINGTITKISIYNNGERTDMFTEVGDSKTAKLDSETIFSININNGLETDNNWQTFLQSIIANIKSIKYNEKQCYIIKYFTSNTSLVNKDSTKESGAYIEKDTGLNVKEIEGDNITEKEYEFDNVNDSIFVEPDISQYKLK